MISGQTQKCSCNIHLTLSKITSMDEMLDLFNSVFTLKRISCNEKSGMLNNE